VIGAVSGTTENRSVCDLTIRWWEHELADYAPSYRRLLVRELDGPRMPRRSAYFESERDVPMFEISEEASILAEGYVSQRPYFIASYGGSLHVAIASGNKPTVGDLGFSAYIAMSIGNRGCSCSHDCPVLCADDRNARSF